MKLFLTIKNAHHELLLFRRRLFFAVVFVIVLSLFLFFRLIYLQLFQGQHFTTLSTTNAIRLLPISPTRGLIYDRNGVVLAKNIPVFNLMVEPDKVANLKATIASIQEMISLSKDDIETFYKVLKQHRRFEEIPLKVKLSEDEVAKIAVNQFKMPGVSVEAGLIRQYPLGSSFAHVVGYVGRINTQELQHVDIANYAATNFMGKVGVEKYFESELHGQVGHKKEEVDAAGRKVRALSTTPSKRGTSIYLTIDSKLQLAAGKALSGLRGSVVAIEPSTGQVLALVSVPEYDPNVFVTGISRKDYAVLIADLKHPLYNRSIRGLYPPGSTIKPFIGLAALNSGMVDTDYQVNDPGWFRLPNSSHVYHDWKRGGHGWTNITKAIIESCDTYFYTVGHEMGIEPIEDVLEDFGFGRITGIEMGEELGGTVPSPEWKKAHVGKSWYPGDTVLTSIGQGYMQTTPLQLAFATATLAMRGKKMQPTLLLAIKEPSGKRIDNAPSQEASTAIDNPDHWQVIIDAMKKVVSEGTGYHFGRPSYVVAAKTGTAQVISQDVMSYQAYKELPKDLRDNSVFIAFAPVKDPKIAIAVVIEHSHEAPQVARKVMDEYFKHARNILKHSNI